MATSWQISKFRHSFIQDVQLLASNTPKSGGDSLRINEKHPGGAQTVSSSRHNLISKGAEYLKSSGIQHLLTLQMCLSLYIQTWPNTSTE